ncbi:MAG: HD domain-containing protein [Deltaproteobacteria bacterium]|nr:HD domain-containing protein [Deltaproteobacteria bacterium]
MPSQKVDITLDKLIDIVKRGGTVKTGVDVLRTDGTLLLERDVLIRSVKPLLIIKESGLDAVPIHPGQSGGMWDKNGQALMDKSPPVAPGKKRMPVASPKIKEKVEEIGQLKKEAARKYRKAKENIKKVIDDIKKTGGQFDYQTVESTVTDLFDYITKNENAFFYLTREIFSYDDYLYNHSINVCTIGTAIMKKFSSGLGSVGRHYGKKMLHDISIGFFLHDVGKVLIPDSIMNKTGKLTPAEFELIKTHSYEAGLAVLEKNQITNPLICDMVKLHHAAIVAGETNSYPPVADPSSIEPYVKICKLADMYDAMTSKRSYKDAFNPIGVVTSIVRGYAEKDDTLQLVLHSFVECIGIYPPGSVVYLVDGHQAYVLDSVGPIVVPFIDADGNILHTPMDPIDLSDPDVKEAGWWVDSEKHLIAPAKVYPLLPDYLKQPPAA